MARGRPIIVDVEASGFGGQSYPIEVGVAMDDETKFCSLIAPAPDWKHWDGEAEKLHGITREVLDSHGRPIQEVAGRMNELLDGKTVFTDGWVVDKAWLSTLFERAGIEMRFRVSALESILSERQMDIWHATKDKVVAEAERQNREDPLQEPIFRHRASFDAWVIQETYKRTLDETRTAPA